MNRLELQQQAKNLFGWGWQSTLARGLGVDDRTVRRWGVDVEVPPYVEAVLEGLLALREAGQPLPQRWTSSIEHRRRRMARMGALRALCAEAFGRYRARALDHVAIPDRVGREEALVIADALESQGDVSAFRLGRRIRELAAQC